MLTTYSATPLYDGAGWLFRGYWTCVTLLMLYVLHEFDTSKASLIGSIRDLVRSGERSFVRPIAAISTLVAICVLAAGFLVRLQVDGRAKYEAPSQPALDAALRSDNGNPHSRLQWARLPAMD